MSSKSISIEAKRIKVIKEWLKPKSVWNIQVFLSFANFYWQFIQGFSIIAAPLTSILKTTVSWLVLVANKVLAANKVDGIEGDDELIEKCGKLLKTGKLSKSRKLSKSEKSKSEKMSKCQNLAKSRKMSSKSGNSTNFDATENKLKFLTPNTRTAFNCLRLAFIEAPILWHFDPECYIWIETDALGYAIGDMLS